MNMIESQFIDGYKTGCDGRATKRWLVPSIENYVALDMGTGL